MTHRRIDIGGASDARPPLVIYDRPASAFVAGFIGDMNFLEGEIVEVDEDGWSASIGPLLVRGLGDDSAPGCASACVRGTR